MKCLSSAALAASLSLAVPAFAAQPPATAAAPAPTTTAATPAPAPTPPPTSAAPSSAPAAGAATAASAGVNASASVGMPVHDSTGAAIGQITAVTPDASGKTMATVKMGTQSFSIDASSLAIAGGAATINATKAQILQQIPK